MEYTKGEWKVSSPADDSIKARIIYTEEAIVATVNDEANANPIATTPKLYEALKALLEWVELSYTNDTGEWADENDPAIVLSKQALAKAEGKEV